LAGQAAVEQCQARNDHQDHKHGGRQHPGGVARVELGRGCRGGRFGGCNRFGCGRWGLGGCSHRGWRSGIGHRGGDGGVGRGGCLGQGQGSCGQQTQSQNEGGKQFFHGMYSLWDAAGLGPCLKGFLAGFAGADAHHLLQVADENLAVADLAGACSAFNGFDHAVDQVIVHGGLDLHLGQKVDHILGAAVQLGMALLAAEALDLGDRDALHPDVREGFAHFVELEGFDDGCHHFHSLVQSRALLGLQAPAGHRRGASGQRAAQLHAGGLADVEVKEARERVRSALQNAGLEFPHNKRITVNLAPADLPKDSGRFDLPIALGILAASGQIDASRLAGYEFAGELSLSGELRPVRGALATSLALHPPGGGAAGAATGQRRRSRPGARRAGLRARHLLDVVRHFCHRQAPRSPSDSAATDDGWCLLQPAPLATQAVYADLADVKGQAVAKRALEIAAAGGHSLLDDGPPGSGKSMLAQRFAGLLPAMTVDEALESAAVASLAGRFSAAQWAQRPTSQPHHTASAVALVGGGSPPRPEKSHWPTTACCFWTNCRSFPVPRWKPCASRWRPGTSPSRAPRSARSFRRGFRWWPP
jgi:hypothetical protein